MRTVPPMRKISLVLGMLFAFFLSHAQEKSNLRIIDIFNMEFISDPQISPDGSQILYVRNFKDIMTDRNLSNIWAINSDGSNNRPVTTGNQNDSYPRWSNDGKKIIFKSNRSDDRVKLFLMQMDTKETVALTNGPNAPNNVSWSPDDTFLAFNMFVPKEQKSIIKLPPKPAGASWNKPPAYIDKLNYRGDGRGYLKNGNMQLFTLSVEGGTPQQLTFTDADHGAPVWAKNGLKLYFSANINAEEAFQPLNTEVYQLDLFDMTESALTNRFGPDESPIVSPDGKKIAYLGFDDELLGYQLTQLYVMDISKGISQNISENFDRSIENIAWAKDSKGVYFQYNDEGETKIAHMSLSGTVTDKVKQVGGLSLGKPYNLGTYTVSSSGNIAYTLGTTQHPADLGFYSKKETKRLTFVNDDLFSFKKIGNVDELWWKSSHDQLEIQGWVVTPPDFDPTKKYPLVLEIHGGPFLSYGSVYSTEIQAYAAAGYVVLYSNPRGSASYGKAFGNLIHHAYPNHDYDDLMSGVDTLISEGYIDTDNLFVTGGSGGGLLTAWIVGKTDRFKAAVVAEPVINWTSFVLYADNPALFSKYWFGKKPWEDPQNYFERSPLSYVKNMTTPTMLLTGEEDYRTPIAESEQFYAALKLEGVETAMVRIPGASHGIANRPSNLIAKIAATLAWFEKYKNE